MFVYAYWEQFDLPTYLPKSVNRECMLQKALFERTQPHANV